MIYTQENDLIFFFRLTKYDGLFGFEYDILGMNRDDSSL